LLLGILFFAWLSFFQRRQVFITFLVVFALILIIIVVPSSESTHIKVLEIGQVGHSFIFIFFIFVYPMLPVAFEPKRFLRILCQRWPVWTLLLFDQNEFYITWPSVPFTFLSGVTTGITTALSAEKRSNSCTTKKRALKSWVEVFLKGKLPRR